MNAHSLTKYVCGTGIAVLAMLFAYAYVANAETSIVNTIHVESSTGGNVVSGEVVSSGSSYSSVEITTIKNGDVVQHIATSSEGAPIRITETYESVEGDTYAYSKVQLNAEATPTLAEATQEEQFINQRATAEVEHSEDAQPQRIFSQTASFVSRILAYVLSTLF